MASMILLNSVRIQQGNATQGVRAGETVTDLTIQALIIAAGGALWPASDTVVAAAAAIALKLRAQGADDRVIGDVMQTSTLNSLAMGATQLATIPVATSPAGTDVVETPNGLIGPNTSGPLGSVYFVPNATALTASNSNYLTFTVSKRTAGGAPVTIAQVTTQLAPTGSGNWTAWQAVPIPLVGSPTLAALDALTYSTTHTGSGVILPAGMLFLFSGS